MSETCLRGSTVGKLRVCVLPEEASSTGDCGKPHQPQTAGRTTRQVHQRSLCSLPSPPHLGDSASWVGVGAAAGAGEAGWKTRGRTWDRKTWANSGCHLSQT